MPAPSIPRAARYRRALTLIPSVARREPLATNSLRSCLPDHGARIGEEAVKLLAAPQCPSGITTIILDGPQVALQVHESCGHPIELDRVLGYEAGFVGKSFLTTDKLGHFRYGSDVV